MNLPGLAVKRPVATAMILVLILVIGLVSLYQSPLDLLPEINAPVLAVITVFPGSSPQETLELVTKPVEEGVSAVSGLTGLNSFSQENLSLVVLRFDWGVDVKRLREDVGVRMDLIDFPEGVQRPLILEFDPTLMPIMQVSASGTDDPVLLTEWLEDTVTPRLESVRGVAGVQVQGGARQDLFVRASPEVMTEYEVSFEQITNVLRASLMDLPAGIIDMEDRQVRIRFLGRYAESDLLSDLIVGFKVDQEALEALIGDEIDINLNQMLAGQGDLLARGDVGRVPMREIYWDDFFDFDRAFAAGGEVYIPIRETRIAGEAVDADRVMNMFTAAPGISYDPSGPYLIFSLNALGLTPLVPEDSFLDPAGPGPALLGDLWLAEQASWENGLIIVPLNASALVEKEIGPVELAALARVHPLVVMADTGYVVLTFHENWTTARSEPLLTVPDYGTWLSGVRGEVSRGLDRASRDIEEGLTDLAASMILGSMSPGGSSFAGLDLGEDFPLNPVSLGMLADIQQDTYNPTTITRYNRQPSIGLSIQKEGDANTVLVARQVRIALDRLSEESAGNFSRVTFNTVFDQAEEIERALADLAWSLVGGAFLAIMVLIFFLKNWRTTMFIGISIPAAIIATFTLLYFTNLTINLMTLGGLALAAGMLVDNAIVVSENIYRHYQMDKTPADAAVDGAREVAGAITASTLTTISVFFPVVFLSGLAGQLFWEFALTVGCAILASLLVALTVIPLLASRTLRPERDRRPQKERKIRLPRYRDMLKLAVRHPWWVVIFAVLFVGLGALNFSNLGTELFPSPDESAFTIDINLPPGSTLSATDSYVQEVERILEGKGEITSYTARVGGSGFMGLPSEGGSSNLARVRAEISPRHLGEIDHIIGEVRREVEALPAQAETNFARESLLDAAGLETRLDLTVNGSDMETVTRITERAVQVLSALPQFSDVQSSLEESRPEVHIRLDHGQALQKGVTLVQVATAVRQAFEGIPVSRIETDTGILNVVLGYEKSEINTVEDLGRIGFYTPSGEYLHLDEVAGLEEAFGPQSIPRENQQVVGQIQVQYGDLDLGTATSEALEALSVLDLPEGYEITTAGSSTLMGDVLSELQLVVIVAALLVYLVMAAQFESLLHPFIIILTLPLAYTGSILGLVVTGNAISIPAMIGVVVLSGILVNDGIIMVDFINQQRRLHGLKLNKAIVEGASARLRPILMTTATTVLGLLPLALGFGEGSQLQAPMAITIIGGQVTGTLLLLLAVPSIYRVVTREKAEVLHKAAVPAYAGATAQPGGGFYPVTAGSARGKTFPGGRKVKGRPVTPVILRLVLVVVLLALVLVLVSLNGQGLLAVIR